MSVKILFPYLFIICSSIIAICITHTTEYISTIKDIVLATASMVAIYVGMKGLDTWQRQLKGNTEYNLLKNACIALYELRELIKKVSNPDYRPKVEPATLNESDKEYDIVKQCHILTWKENIQVPYKCSEIIDAAENKLLLCLVELDAVFKTDLLEKINPIEKLLNRLRNTKYNLHNYYRIINDPYRGSDNPPQAIPVADDSNEYMNEFEKAFSDFNKKLNEHLEKYK